MFGDKIKKFVHRLGKKRLFRSLARIGRKAVHGAATFGRKVLHFVDTHPVLKTIAKLVPGIGPYVDRILEKANSVVGFIEKVDQTIEGGAALLAKAKRAKEALRKGDKATAKRLALEVANGLKSGVDRIKHKLNPEDRRKIDAVLAAIPAVPSAA